MLYLVKIDFLFAETCKKMSWAQLNIFELRTRIGDLLNVQLLLKVQKGTL